MVDITVKHRGTEKLPTQIKGTFAVPAVPGWYQQKVQKGKEAQHAKRQGLESVASRSKLSSPVQSEVVRVHIRGQELVFTEIRASFFQRKYWSGK